MTSNAGHESSELVLDGEIAVFKVIRATSLQAAIELVRDAIAQAYQRRWFKLLVVISDSPGIEIPSLAMRSSMARRWAEASRGLVAAAMVCRPEFIDPHKFGVIMASNYGMVTNVLADEVAAREWLLQLK